MMQIKYRDNEPAIDESCHVSAEEIGDVVSVYQYMCSGFSLDQVFYLVQRNIDGSRETPQQVFADVEQGIVGDRWFLDENRELSEQVAMMNIHIAKFFANGQKLTLFGDSLFVDFDISPENMPVGTKIKIGEAIFVVTDEMHGPCSKFKKRFGTAAFQICATEKHRHYRGIYLQVLQSGDIWIGAEIQKLPEDFCL